MEMFPYHILSIFVVVAIPTRVDALFGIHVTDSGARGHATKLSLAVVLGVLHQSHALIQFGDMLPEIRQCWTDYTNKTSTLWQNEHKVVMTEKMIHMRCMEKFMWKADQIRWSDYDVSKDDLAWLTSLLMQIIQFKHKKGEPNINDTFSPSGPDDVFPPTGFRRRREYRRLSDDERNAFHNAVNVLKRNGRYDALANIHVGFVITQAHCGPNFYSWHRIYVLIMEEALRQIDRRVSIPYWDSTFDSELDDPADSIIWSSSFFGNGDGFVTSGPFANWTVGNTTLLRNLGRVTTIKLFAKEEIQLVLSRCKMEEISVPTGKLRYNLEYYHNGGHFFVGGHMFNLETTVHDPVFFLHHSFVDYLVEQFRIHQVRHCHENPENDYPPVTGMHGPDEPMAGLPPFVNSDGFLNQWTRYWYRYERSPWYCSRLRPDCGTPYLRCNVEKGRCVTEVRLITAKRPTGELITAPPSTFKELAAATRIRANKEQDSIMEFAPPPTDNSTYCQNAESKRESRFRRFVLYQSPKTINEVDTSSGQSHFESTVTIPASNGRSSDITSGTKPSSPTRHLSFPVSLPGPLLPLVDGPVPSTSWRSHSQWQDGNTFAKYTNNLHIKEMVYILTKIIYVAPSSKKQQTTEHYFSSYGAQLRRTCKKNATGSINVSVHAQGLNYVGSHRNKVIVDSRFGESSATTYIAVKKPEMGTSEVLLSAFDECGNVCHPECISDGADPVEYRPCTGVFRVTSQQPAMYTETVPDALHATSRKSVPYVAESERIIRIIFRCSYSDMPWQL